MKLYKTILFIFISSLSFNLYADTTLTEKSVHNLIMQILESSQSQDTVALGSYFTKDAVIIIDMPENMGGKIEVGVKEYLLMLEQGWNSGASFTNEVKNIVIKIDENQQAATVKDDTYETVSVDGETLLSSRTAETINVIATDSGPKITRIIGVVNILPKSI